MNFGLRKITLIQTIFILIVLEVFSSFVLKNSYTYSELLDIGRKINFQNESNTAHPLIYEYSDYLPFTLPKKFDYRHHYAEFNVKYKINEFGYRGLFPKSIKKDPDKTRILFIGDSFTFGFGVNNQDSFVELNKLYTKNQNIEYINAGYHAGDSLDAYYAYLKKEGLILSPSFVLIFIYSGNDIEDIQNHYWNSLNENGLPEIIRTKRNFISYEGVFFFLKDKSITPWNYKIPVLNNSNLFIALTNMFNVLIFPKRNINTLLKGSFYKQMSMDTAKNNFQLSLIGINNLLKERGVSPIFFVIPEVRAYPERSENFKVSLSNHAEIISILTMVNDLKFIDLYPHLAHEDYFEKDAHLNARGHFIVNKVIREAIRFE